MDGADYPTRTSSRWRASPATKSARKRSRKIIRLTTFIPYRMSLLVGRLTVTNSELDAKGHKLTVQEWRVLSVVADFGPIAPAEIRRRGTQDKSTISWAIKRLLDRGLISRRAKADDARTFEVSLSDQGWSYYEKVAPIATKRARNIFARLTATERRQLGRLILKLENDN